MPKYTSMTEIYNKVYVFVVNSIGFLKTLEKKGIKNNTTIGYSKLVRTFNKEFNNFYEKKILKNDEISTLIAFIKQIENFLIKNFEDIDKEVIYEKTSLYRQANEIERMLNEKNKIL